MEGRHARLWAVGAVALVVVAVFAGMWWYAGAHPTHSYPIDPELAPIRHIFIVVQENHAYDNYFGTYCTATGAYCSNLSNGLPGNVCLPISLTDPTSGCVKPFALNNTTEPAGDLPHSSSAYTRSYDGGKMDGFIQADAGRSTPMGYYPPNAVSFYWDLAEEYGLGDAFFSQALAASIANHWFLIAGSAPAASYQNTLPDFESGGSLTSAGRAYLNEANTTVTLADQLQAAGLSWTVYDYPIAANGYASFLSNGSSAKVPTMTPFDEFDPFVAKASSFSPSYASHFVSRYDLGPDLAGTGPIANVSWIFPDVPLSEHPPGDPWQGEQWTSHIVDSIENSSVWSSSAIFLTWDEAGGWYDHVAPPGENGTNPGFRIPFLVVSPYARENFLDPQFGTFSSILHFVDERYGLAPLSGVVGSAPSLVPYFDFNQTPRAPMTFGPNESYPIPLQAVTTVAAHPSSADPSLSVRPFSEGTRPFGLPAYAVLPALLLMRAASYARG